MSSAGDGVTCTVHDGAMWMHLDDVTVKIPPQMLSMSQVLTNAMSVASPSEARKVTLAAPKEWLQSWIGCFCTEKESLSNKDNQTLVHCLLVCPSRLECGYNRADVCYSCRYSVRS
jgi:hypothetical protein